MAPLLASKPDEDILCEASTTATSDFRACLGTNAAEDVASTASPSVLPQINTERLWNDIHNTARWGALSNSTGVSRLALSDEDRCVRNWFVKEAKILGCEVNVDEMGNIFAVLVGTDHTIAPIGIGSHLDTQPSGGRFDGVLGVIGALEVLRTIKESGMKTHASIAAIDWTNEEGARFLPGYSGSSVWSGHTTLSSAYAQTAKAPLRELYTSLSDIGFVGATSCSHVRNPISAHFELHIEQGPILEQSKKSAGIVRGIQGIRRHEVTVYGQEGHAGTVAMSERDDALVAAASIVVSISKRARMHRAFATVGTLEVKNSSVNKIPGEVAFSIDMRHPDEAVLNDLEAELTAEMHQMEATNPKLQFHSERLWHFPASAFDTDVLSCLRSSATEVVGLRSTMEMRSFAGHDSGLTATVVPTAMLFVPSIDGISHAPEEWTSKEDCGQGVQILLQAVLKYDELLHKKRFEK